MQRLSSRLFKSFSLRRLARVCESKRSYFGSSFFCLFGAGWIAFFVWAPIEKSTLWRIFAGTKITGTKITGTEITGTKFPGTKKAASAAFFESRVLSASVALHDQCCIGATKTKAIRHNTIELLFFGL